MFEVIILSILQGIAEFLPISSSGHLVLGRTLLGLGDVGMRLDICLHVGTLIAVFVFYFAVIRRILVDLEWFYLLKILVSAIPAGLVGVLFKDQLEVMFSSPRAVGFALIFTGIVLSLTRLLPKGEGDVSFGRALLMGLAQAIAILPGISRSGMTLAAARAARVEAEKSAEFSFLMSAPPIAGAAFLQIVKSVKGAEETATSEPSWTLCIIGAAVAALVGYAALKFMLRSLKSNGFWLFGPYCALAGAVTLLLA